MNPKKLSIIIVHYKTPELLLQCISGIFQSPPRVPFEVIVVDNNSQDHGAQSVIAQFPSVCLLQNHFNYGFAVANNQGYRQSVGEYVMPVNPDTRLPADAIEKMYNHLEQNSDVGLVSPALFEHGRAVLPWHTFIPVEAPWIFRRAATEVTSSAPIESPWIFGTGYICRREALHTDHIFDEALFLFGEEFALCRSIRQRGYRLVMLPDAQIEHHISASFKYNPERLLMARRLSTAALYRARGEEFGVVTALVDQIVCCLSNALLWSALSVKELLRPDPSGGRRRMIGDYLSNARGSFAVIMGGEPYIQRVNIEAWQFFNQGVMPVMPPQPTITNPAMS